VRARLASALVLSGLAAGVSGGCGGGDSVSSPDSVRACLEAGGSDVLLTPLGKNESLTYALGQFRVLAVAFAGLPAGGVASVGFYETAEGASSASAALEGMATLGGAEPTENEVAESALVLWRREAKAGDRELLLSCLESGEGEPGGVDAVLANPEPANPLGCVRVFLTSGATNAQKERIEARLLDQPSTREVRFVSKAEALAELRESQPELTENLHGNPLPDSFAAGPTRGDRAPSIAAAVRNAPGVEQVSTSSAPCAVLPLARG
jgi:hypothetical protein